MPTSDNTDSPHSLPSSNGRGGLRVAVLHNNKENAPSLNGELPKDALAELDITDIPIVVALNKIDRLDDAQREAVLAEQFPHSVPISALKQLNLDRLLKLIEHELYESLLPLTVRLPYRRSDLVAMFHDNGRVDEETYGESSIIVTGRLPARYLAMFRPFVMKGTAGVKA